jgi:hypothetical protein
LTIIGALSLIAERRDHDAGDDTLLVGQTANRGALSAANLDDHRPVTTSKVDPSDDRDPGDDECDLWLDDVPVDPSDPVADESEDVTADIVGPAPVIGGRRTAPAVAEAYKSANRRPMKTVFDKLEKSIEAVCRNVDEIARAQGKTNHSRGCIEKLAALKKAVVEWKRAGIN